MVLLGDIDELKEQRERPQHGALALRAERCDRVGESLPWAAGAGITGKAADPLLVVEEILALLLDENLPEQITEEADVGTESGIGRHPRSVVGHTRGSPSRRQRGNVKEPSRFDGAASGNRQDGLRRVTTALHHRHDTHGEHRQAPVRDVLFVATVIAFFAVAALFVRICEAIVGPTTDQVDE